MFIEEYIDECRKTISNAAEPLANGLERIFAYTSVSSRGGIGVIGGGSFTRERAVVSSAIKTEFSVWLEGHLPGCTKAYVLCLDGISQFLIDNDVLSHELWWFNGFDQFEVIFETLLRMNILAEVDEQTHDLFVKAGAKIFAFLTGACSTAART